MNPLAWINGKLGAFMALPAQLDALYETARQVFYAEAQARVSGGGVNPVQSEREVAAIEAMVQIDRMKREWSGIYSKMVIERRDSLGAAVPFALVVVAVKTIAAVIIVLAITALLRKKTAIEGIVQELARSGATAEQIIEAMRVAPEEQSALDSVVSGVRGLVKWSVLGGIAFLVIPRVLSRN